MDRHLKSNTVKTRTHPGSRITAGSDSVVR
jgi:hypothetical protein